MFWSALLGSLACGGALAGFAAAQEPVPLTIVVPINGTKKLQMSGKQLIESVQSQDPAIVRTSPMPEDPTSFLVTGLMAGVTRITVTDKNKRSEAFDVIVQLDVAFLRRVLQETVPSANITPIPVGTGSIILSGTVAKAEDIPIAHGVARSIAGGITLVDALRVGGVQQVQLCVSVAKVSRSQMRQMSFEFLRSGPNNVFASTLGDALSFTSASGPINATSAMANATGLPGNLFYGIMTPDHSFFGWLQALRDEGVTKILAEPKVTTISGRSASFLDGGEQAVPVPAGLGQIGVQFEEFGTRLNVLPIVLGNGKIHLEVEPEVSNLDPASGTSIGGTVVPGRVTQRVHTSVEMETGQTFAIGGLVQRRIGSTATKVPILGDVPFFGMLFRGLQYTEQEDELLILVTPYLVDPLACNQLPKYRPGEETRSPDDFELFLEGILEAPRGPRETCVNGRYQAAWKNGPTAGAFPCGGYDCGSRGFCDCQNGACGAGGACGNGACSTGGACGTGKVPAAGEFPAGTQPLLTAPAQTPALVPTGATPMTSAVQAPAQPAFETLPLAVNIPTEANQAPAVQETSLAAPVSLPPPTSGLPPATEDQVTPAANFGIVAGNDPH